MCNGIPVGHSDVTYTHTHLNWSSTFRINNKCQLLFPCRHSSEEHIGQFDNRAVCWPDESVGRQGAQCGPRFGSGQWSDVFACSLEETWNHGGPGQRFHTHRDPKSERLNMVLIGGAVFCFIFIYLQIMFKM